MTHKDILGVLNAYDTLGLYPQPQLLPSPFKNARDVISHILTNTPTLLTKDPKLVAKAIDSLTKLSDPASATALFMSVPMEIRTSSTEPIHALLQCYGEMGMEDATLLLFDQFKTVYKLTPTIDTYNALVTLYARLGDMQKAESMARPKSDSNEILKPNVLTYLALLSGYAHKGQLTPVAKYLDLVLKSESNMQDTESESLRTKAFNYELEAVLVNTSTREPTTLSGTMITKYKLLRTHSKFKPNHRSFELMILANALPGHVRLNKALHYFHKRSDIVQNPNAETLSALLTAYVNSGEIMMAYALLRELTFASESNNAIVFDPSFETSVKWMYPLAKWHAVNPGKLNLVLEMTGWNGQNTETARQGLLAGLMHAAESVEEAASLWKESGMKMEGSVAELIESVHPALLKEWMVVNATLGNEGELVKQVFDAWQNDEQLSLLLDRRVYTAMVKIAGGEEQAVAMKESMIKLGLGGRVAVFPDEMVKGV